MDSFPNDKVAVNACLNFTPSVNYRIDITKVKAIEDVIMIIDALDICIHQVQGETSEKAQRLIDNGIAIKVD